MKIYKVKDTVSGLYYCPSKDISIKLESGATRYVKTNLSKKGKLYRSDPRKHISSFFDHTKISNNYSTLRKDIESFILEEVVDSKANSITLLDVNRIEVISKKGREFVKYSEDFEFSLQDDGNTLKIFC